MIPYYIKNSELYQSLSNEEDYENKINTKYILEDDFNIKNNADLSKILDVCRFWNSYEFPWKVYDFIYENLELDYSEIFKDFEDYEKIDDIKLILEYNNDKHMSSEVEVVRSLMGYLLLSKIFEKDNLNLFKWFEKKQSFKDLYGYEFCVCASRYGSINCLKYLIKEKYTLKGNCCEMAIDFNHVECLKLLHINKAKWTDEEIKYGIKKNSIECVEYLKNKKCLYVDDGVEDKDINKKFVINYININYTHPFDNLRFSN